MEEGMLQGGGDSTAKMREGLDVLRKTAGAEGALAEYSLDRHYAERNPWLDARGIDPDALGFGFRGARRNTGIWDTIVLWALFKEALSRPEDLLWLYHHSKDPPLSPKGTIFL